MEAAHRTLQAISAVGGRFVVVIDAVSDERATTAGRSGAARRLAGAELDALVDRIREVAELARSRYELRPVLHPHAGSYIEFEDEIDAVLERVEPNVIELCVDTGHCAYSGIDPVALYRATRSGSLTFTSRTWTARSGLGRSRTGSRSGTRCMRASSAHSARGVVDFTGLAQALAEASFDGWATVEQDRDPAAASDALADVIESRRFLERTGIAQMKARRREAGA